MKEKILAALKTKYKNMGLSDKVLEKMAAIIAATITEEADIDNAVSGVEDLLKGFQSDSDKRVTDAVAKAKKDAEAKENNGGAPAKENEPEKKEGEGIPEWAKGLVETNKALLQEISALKAGKTTETRKSILETKLKDINPKLREKALKDFSRMQFDTDDEFNAFVDETAKDLGEFSQAEAEKGLSGLGSPMLGAGGKAGEKEISPAMKQIINERKAAVAKTA